MDNYDTLGFQIARELAQEYNLSWASQVNLEAIINNKLLDKLTEEEIVDVLVDMFENIFDFEIRRL